MKQKYYNYFLTTFIGIHELSDKPIGIAHLIEILKTDFLRDDYILSLNYSIAQDIILYAFC